MYTKQTFCVINRHVSAIIFRSVKGIIMLQINSLTLMHRKDFRVILEDFHLVLNNGDKADFFRDSRL